MYINSASNSFGYRSKTLSTHHKYNSSPQLLFSSADALEGEKTLPAPKTGWTRREAIRVGLAGLFGLAVGGTPYLLTLLDSSGNRVEFGPPQNLSADSKAGLQKHWSITDVEWKGWHSPIDNGYAANNVNVSAQGVSLGASESRKNLLQGAEIRLRRQPNYGYYEATIAAPRIEHIYGTLAVAEGLSILKDMKLWSQDGPSDTVVVGNGDRYPADKGNIDSTKPVKLGMSYLPAPKEIGNNYAAVQFYVNGDPVGDTSVINQDRKIELLLRRDRPNTPLENRAETFPKDNPLLISSITYRPLKK